MKSFFTWHIYLEVDKTQDLPSKIWQTLGDALYQSHLTFLSFFFYSNACPGYFNVTWIFSSSFLKATLTETLHFARLAIMLALFFPSPGEKTLACSACHLHFHAYKSTTLACSACHLHFHAYQSTTLVPQPAGLRFSDPHVSDSMTPRMAPSNVT
jgi:hypothetical protein